MTKIFRDSRRLLSRFALAIFIIIVMCGSTVVANAQTTVTDEQSFINAINSTETEIIVENDITLTREYQITRNLTIKSTENATLNWSGAANRTMFTVNNNANFTLEDITLDGKGLYATLVEVKGSTFTMNDGAVLKNVLSNGSNRAVTIGNVSDPSLVGTFNMNGGLITGVSLDAVVICYYGTINMGGSATISENSAYGVGIITSTLNMTGNAAISNNTATRAGMGVLAGYDSVINMGLQAGDAPRISGNTSTTNYGGGAYLVDSELNMDFGASIAGNTAETMGGGVALNRSTLIMNGNAKVSNNTTRQGVGGGILANNSTVDLSDNAAVFGNSVMADDGNGGGIYLQNAPSLLTISDKVKVYDNNAAFGAGIFLHVETELQMSGGAVSTNIATLDGSGIYSRGKATISGGVVDDNRTVSGNGGGIYLTSEGSATISGSSITNNSAPNGYGGGVYSEITQDYSTLSTDSGTRFYGNRASTAYTPPENALELYPHIQFASVSIGDHPLNNYDINVTDAEVLMFNVTYASNGGTGHFVGPYTIPSHTVMILSPEEAGITRAFHTFIVWNTAPDGSGQSYAPGDTMVLNNNVTLYAQWNVELAWFWGILLALILGLVIIMTCFCFRGRRCQGVS